MLRKNPEEHRPQIQAGMSLKPSAQFFLISVDPDEFRIVLYPKRFGIRIDSAASSGTVKLHGFFHSYQSKTSTNIPLYFAFIIPRMDATNLAANSVINFNTVHTRKAKTCVMAS